MRLFKKKASLYDEHEQKLIEKVIETLKTHPEDFSAKWFCGKSLDKSVRHKNKELLILKSGEIIAPIETKMSADQKLIVKNILKIIIKRDSDWLIKKFTL